MYLFFEFVFLVVIPVWAVTTVVTKRIEAAAADPAQAPSMAALIEQSADVSSRVDALERALGKRPEEAEAVR
ncbi:MAG: hypothetical protein KIT73_12335 [Burkholderiales bacterium]|nr:hypothetical protein [Burkholderiales bacterium]